MRVSLSLSLCIYIYIYIFTDAIPDGIALDTISRLLYYTDAGNKIIAAMTLAEKYHVTIIKRHLNKPRAIALDPIRG